MVGSRAASVFEQKGIAELVGLVARIEAGEFLSFDEATMSQELETMTATENFVCEQALSRQTRSAINKRAKQLAIDAEARYRAELREAMEKRRITSDKIETWHPAPEKV